MSDWDDALDALDEWVRRTAAELAGSQPAQPTPAPALPSTPVPDGLRLRAQALMATMRSTEAEVLRRREQLRREQAYGAS